MIFSKFERMVALRYLKAKRKEGFISVITGFSLVGIALGVATLIIVMSVMNGFKTELLSRILGLNGHIMVVSTPGYPFTDYTSAVQNIEDMDGIELAIPMIEKQILVSTGNTAEGAMVRGIQKEDLIKKEVLRQGLENVNIAAFSDEYVILGERLADKLGLMTGDEITLISPNGKVTAFGTVPRIKSYVILGTFNVGMYEYDSNFIFMPLESAQKFFGLNGAATQIDVSLKNGQDLKRVRRVLEESVGLSAYIYDWKQSNAAFFNAIDVERNVMFLILTLIILVAAFNIITGLIMLVKDKARDVAVLRTMGATKGMMMRIFMMDGAYIGILGTLIGTVLGIVFCENIETVRHLLEKLSGRDLFSAEIYFLSKLPAEINWTEVLMVALISLLLSLLATIYPAYKAAKYDPVEALRYE